MTALPPVVLGLEHFEHSPGLSTVKANGKSAYQTCLTFEKQAQEKNDQIGLVQARVLGYLIQHYPNTETSLKKLSKDIHSCNQNYEQLSALGQLYINCYVCLFRRTEGRTPAPSDHSSRNSFDIMTSDIETRLTECPKSHAGAKRLALVRDKYRCLLTGYYDDTFVDLLPADQRPPSLPTECAHILPQSVFYGMSDKDSDGFKRANSAGMLAILEGFGYKIDDILGDKVNSLFNVMTLVGYMHDAFDSLRLWFETTPVTNKYKIRYDSRYNNNVLFTRLPKTIVFTTPDPEKYPVPSKELLGLHATCCKVANLSGAAQFINKLERDEEDIRVLATDGSSAQLLHHALVSRLIGVGV